MIRKETFPRSLPGQPIDHYVERTELIPPFEVDEALAEQMRQAMPSIAVMAISLIPFSEVVVRKVQKFLNDNYKYNL